MPHDDNVIDLAAILLARAKEAGASPLDVVAALTGLGTPEGRADLGLGAPGGFDLDGFAGPFRITPTLLPRREQPVTYRVRVDLDGAKPPIWRRLDIPSDLTLDRVHHLLQAAMGWTDSHLHAFTMGPDGQDRRMERFLTPYDVAEGEEGILERDVRLDEVLAEPGHRLYYEYDFGDGWAHTLKVEKVLPAGPAACLAGRRACPPEDCGGIGGYAEILDMLAGGSPSTGPFESLAELQEWLPLDWAPDAFDVAAADAAVRTIAAGGVPGLPPLERLNPTLADLLRRAAGTSSEDTLSSLAVTALTGRPGGFLGLSDSSTGAAAGPDETAVAAAMHPLQVVLDVVGDGADLTAAGYLKPAAVEAIFARLELDEPWIGTAHREDQTLPVATARAAAVALGLLRKRGKRLLPTSAGSRLRADPAGLWRHAAAHLPAGTSAQKDAGMLLVLTTAAGYPPVDVAVVTGRILADVGWRNGRYTHHQFDAAITPTWETMAAVGCFDSYAGRAATDLGVALAAAAVLRD